MSKSASSQTEIDAVIDEQQTAPDQSESDPSIKEQFKKDIRNSFRLKNLLLGSLLGLAIIIVLAALASVLMHSDKGVFQVYEWFDSNKVTLFLMRLLFYILFTLSPVVVFLGVKDKKKRKDATLVFMMIFAILFVFGELFIVQNLIGKLAGVF